jgi:uncharacterized protein YgiM (DUF1202 family)
MKNLYPFLLALLLFSCAPSVSLPTYSVISPTFYYVLLPEALLHEKPAATSPSTTVRSGEKLLVVGRQSPWYVIKHQGITYYILENSLSLAEAETSTTAIPSPTPSAGSGGSYHNVQTGPRGGHYYINKNGNKTYIKRK